MDALTSFFIHALMDGFVAGCVGCALLIPIVAFKFVAVLFETDPATDNVQE